MALTDETQSTDSSLDDDNRDPEELRKRLKNLLFQPHDNQSALFERQNDLSDIAAQIKGGSASTFKSDVSKALNGAKPVSEKSINAIESAIRNRLTSRKYSLTDIDRIAGEAKTLIVELQAKMIKIAENAIGREEGDTPNGPRWVIWPNYAVFGTPNFDAIFKAIPVQLANDPSTRYDICFREKGAALAVLIELLIGLSESANAQDVARNAKTLQDFGDRITCYLLPKEWTITPLVLINPDDDKKVFGEYVFYVGQKAERTSFKIPQPYLHDVQELYRKFAKLPNLDEERFRESSRKGVLCRTKISFSDNIDGMITAATAKIAQRSVERRYQ